MSLQAGADGIVATPVTAVIAGPEDFRAETPQDLQAAVDPEQATLDSLPNRNSRRRYLYEQVKARVDATPIFPRTSSSGAGRPELSD